MQKWGRPHLRAGDAPERPAIAIKVCFSAFQNFQDQWNRFSERGEPWSESLPCWRPHWTSETRISTAGGPGGPIARWRRPAGGAGRIPHEKCSNSASRRSWAYKLFSRYFRNILLLRFLDVPEVARHVLVPIEGLPHFCTVRDLFKKGHDYMQQSTRVVKALVQVLH